MKKICYYSVFLLFTIVARAQNPANLTFNTPQTLTADRYDRATQWIKLQTGFTYSAANTGDKKLNLSIGVNPPFVNSFYDPMAGGLTCNNMPYTDNTKTVGETPGSFAVSSSGAAIYSIPIYVSPGTKGVQPSLSVAYNSQAGNGLLGMGWSLQGLSAITRVPRTPFQDGQYGGVELSNNDVYSFNGQRLFVLSGNYGDDASTYFTEEESFSTITAHGTQGSGPEWIEVKDGTGNILEFGHTSDSRLYGMGSGTVMSWQLNKMTDEFGNYITYTYKVLSGETVIDRIDYTGNANASLAPYNSVTFTYMEAGDKNTVYIAGKQFHTSQLLKEIDCYAGTALVKKYTFDYTWDNATCLAMVTETDAASNQLNPTQICWADANDYTNILSTQNTDIFATSAEYTNLKSAIPADLNGDGFSDLVCVFPFTGQYRVQENAFRQNFGLGNDDINYTSTYNTAPTEFPMFSSYLGGNVCDEDMDNHQEVYSIMTYSATPAQYTIHKIANAPSVPAVTTVNTYTLTNSINAGFVPTQFMYDKNDYTGDGIMDELRIDPEHIFINSSQGNYSYSITTANTIVRPILFDGDGIQDFILMEKASNTLVNITVLKNTGAAFQQVYATSISFPLNGIWFQNPLKLIGLGDLNGDAITDIVYLRENFSNLYIRYGTGVVFDNDQPVSSYTQVSATASEKYEVGLMDLNMDGKADIQLFNDQNKTGTGVNNFFTYHSLGDEIVKGASYSGYWQTFKQEVTHPALINPNFGISPNNITVVTETIDVPQNYLVQSDFNGDGVYDAVSIDPNGNTVATNKVNGRRKTAVFQIRTAFHAITTIKYANLNNELYVVPGTRELVYSDQGSTSYSFPLVKMKPSQYCVHKVITETGFNHQIRNEMDYQYSNAVFHATGRGFLGFESTLAVDKTTGIGTISVNTFDNTYFIPLLSEAVSRKLHTVTSQNITSYVALNSTLFSKSTFQYTMVPWNYSSYIPQLTGQTSKNYLQSIETQTTCSYDLNAGSKIQQKLTTYGWDNNPTVKTVQEDYAYVLNNGIYKLQSLTTTSTQQGDAPYARTTEYNYDSQGRMTSIVNDPSFGTQTLTTTFTQFNAFGQAEKQTVSAGDIASRNTENVYDATGRFVIKTTNTLGHQAEATYEPVFGNVIQQKDILNRVTTYEYDGLGRMKKSVSPIGEASRVTYAWESPANYFYSGFVMGVYSVLHEADNAPYTKSYSDGYHVLRTEQQGFNGAVTYADNKYSDGTSLNTTAGGTLLEKTEPYAANTTGNFLATQYSYDTQTQRLTKTETVETSTSNTPSTLGIATNYSYNNPGTDVSYVKAFMLQTDQAGRQVKFETNVAGQKDVTYNINGPFTQISTSEFGSTGGVLKVTNTNNQTSQSILTTSTFNQLGQQTDLNDPSTGNHNYVYNTLGELLQSSDASGTMDYTYDALGRVTTRTGSVSGTTTYQYVTAGNGKESIKKIIGPNSVVEYQYDALGRITQQKESIDSRDFISNYTYNNLGQLSEREYPGGFKVKNVYDGMGYLTTMKDAANNLIWQRTATNALDQITEYSYGNGITTQESYDAFHQLSQVDHGTLFRQQYAYDPASFNMTQRTFTNFATSVSLQENFNFDDIDRLEQSTHIDPNTLNPADNNQTYDILGNITHKDDAGDYNYGISSQPYTLTSISNAVNTISLNTLTLTYNDLRHVSYIAEASTGKEFLFTYGTNDNRIKMEYLVNSVNQYTRYYTADYDREETTSGVTEWTYIMAPTGLAAVYKSVNSSGQLLYVLSDHLGSPVLITDEDQNIVEELSFDSWGRRRNPIDWTYNLSSTPTTLIRGFTFHEHLDEVGLINMNGRIYDPVLGRLIQPDKYVQEPDKLQNFNRYAYAFNNPLSYTDPDGNWIQTVIGALLGGYSGYNLGKMMGATWGHGLLWYTLGGAAIGALSGGLGELVSGSAMPFCNTAGVLSSSFTSSAMFHVISGGQLPVTASIGIASYNFDTGEAGWWRKGGNTWAENRGYFYGSLSAIQDIAAGTNGTDIEVLARKALFGHSEIKGKDILISVGPDYSEGNWDLNGWAFEKQYLPWGNPGTAKAQNTDFITLYPRTKTDGRIIKPFKTSIHNVNGKILSNMTANISKTTNATNLLGFGKFQYGLFRGCVNYTSRALLFSGVLNINAFLPVTAPALLNLELFIHQVGTYASPYLTNGQLGF